jgi:UDP-glucose 4-epimerase
MAWSRFLVTGAAGFIGASLVRRLLQSGEVTVLLHEEGAPWRLKDVLSRVRVVAGDVADPGVAARAVAESRPDAVYHLAAHGAYESQKDAPRILRTNLMGTWSMLDACASSSCRLFVHAGSSSEYGFRKDPMAEDDALHPNSIYAVGKAAATHLCSYIATKSKCAIVTCRLFSVYGPWEEPSRLVPTILRRCLKDEPLEMVPRETARDFVFVEDVVDAFLKWDKLAAMNGEVFNLGSGRQTTIGEFVDIALDITGSKSDVRWGAMAPRIWDSFTWVADAHKALNGLGWNASTGLRSGLTKTLEWIRHDRT